MCDMWYVWCLCGICVRCVVYVVHVCMSGGGVLAEILLHLSCTFSFTPEDEEQGYT